MARIENCIPYTAPEGVVVDFDQNDPDDARFYIRLRNWERYQDMRGLKDGQRPKWIKFWLDLLISEDWCTSDNATKVLMVALLALAGKSGNRIRNNHSHLAHVCKWDGPEDVVEPFQELFRSGCPDGFFDLTLDPRPDDEVEAMAKPARAKPKPKNPTKRFDEFWQPYPNKKNKKESLKIWQRDNLDAEADAIVAAVKVQARSEDWTKEEGRYVPLPSTYLNKERWLDEATVAAKPAGELTQLDPKRLF